MKASMGMAPPSGVLDLRHGGPLWGGERPKLRLGLRRRGARGRPGGAIQEASPANANGESAGHPSFLQASRGGTGTPFMFQLRGGDTSGLGHPHSSAVIQVAVHAIQRPSEFLRGHVARIQAKAARSEWRASDRSSMAL